MSVAGWFMRSVCSRGMYAAAALCLLAMARTASAQNADILVFPAVEALDAAEPAAPADIEAQLEPYLAQVRPVAETELSFANRVCKFTPEQRAAVLADAKSWLKEYARKQIKVQGGRNVAQWMQVQQRGQSSGQRRSIEDGVAEVVKKHITDEQHAVYEQEFASRRRFHTAAIVDNLIAALDDQLYLSQEQRKALAADLKEHWDESWGLELHHFAHMSNYLPNMPGDPVVKHLSQEQKARWRGIPKVSFGHNLNQEHHWIGGQVIDDIDLGGGPPQPNPDLRVRLN